MFTDKKDYHWRGNIKSELFMSGNSSYGGTNLNLDYFFPSAEFSLNEECLVATVKHAGENVIISVCFAGIRMHFCLSSTNSPVFKFFPVLN